MCSGHMLLMEYSEFRELRRFGTANAPCAQGKEHPWIKTEKVIWCQA